MGWAFLNSSLSHRSVWLLVGVLLIAAAMYLHGMVATLPYQLDPDEPNIWRWANRYTTSGVLFEDGYFYPPLGVMTTALQHRLLYLITPPGQLQQPVYYVTGRVFSMLYSILMLSMVYQAGRHLHSRAAGIAAVLFLIPQPEAVYWSKLLRVDTLAWLLGMISLMCSYRVVSAEKRWLLIPAFVAGALASAVKYTMFPVLMVPTLLIFLFVLRTQAVRKVAIVTAMLGLTGVLLVIVNPPTLLRTFLMGFHARQLYERENFFQFVSLSQSIPRLLGQLGLLNMVIVIIGLPVGVMLWPKERLNGRQGLLIGLTMTMMVATFLGLGLLRTNRAHDRYVIVLGFALLWGLTLALLARRQPMLASGSALILLVPWMIQGWQLGDSMRWPDTRALTVEWFIANVPEGTHIAVEYDRVEFDRGYGGYPSDKIFFVETITSVHEESLESFAQRGTEYLVADYRNIYRGGLFDADTDDTAFLAQVEQVQAFERPWERNINGPARYIFRIPPIQDVPMHVFLGDAIIFKGYDLADSTVSPGDTLGLTLYWAALRETDANYTVFVHVISEDGTLVAQADGLPGDALHRTYDWWPGYFDWDVWPVTIPEGVQPGIYTLTLGMYDAATLARLPAASSDGSPLGDHIVLTEITVEAP